jgi:hypothetical protein
VDVVGVAACPRSLAPVFEGAEEHEIVALLTIPGGLDDLRLQVYRCSRDHHVCDPAKTAQSENQRRQKQQYGLIR